MYLFTSDKSVASLIELLRKSINLENLAKNNETAWGDKMALAATPPEET